MSGRVKKIMDLEVKIKVQEDALMKCSGWNAITTHSYLLQKLTDEWCELTKKLTQHEMMELCEAQGL